MQVRPRVELGAALGAGAALLLALMAAVLLFRVASEPVSLTSFAAALMALALAVGGGLIAFWAWSIATLRYRLTEDALHIHWGLTEHIIPLAAIAAVLPATAAAGPLRIRGVSWPGCHLGRAWAPGLGDIVLASAHLHARELVFVSAGSAIYGLSVPDAEPFAADLRKRQMQARPSAPATPSVLQPRLFGLSLWRDRPGLILLGAGLLANAALFAYVCYVYPDLPTFLPFQVTPAGSASQIGQREDLLLLPAAALAILALNAAAGAVLHRWERLGAYLCLGAATLVQVFVAGAVVRIIG
jgi:hypothetical protein